jgi:hypothetical protein
MCVMQQAQYHKSQDFSTAVRCFTELTRFTPALLSPRFRLSVGTLVFREKGGILSLYEDRLCRFR